ncbi:transglycosylase domain-containing protein [Streptomyces sp. NPDC057445]|uniref:transglycosylase domain-containing protein n=1 Tax=Streptomyces sp. NPDC057445 TaxID=3346136 RepID=UPI0036B7C868
MSDEQAQQRGRHPRDPATAGAPPHDPAPQDSMTTGQQDGSSTSHEGGQGRGPRPRRTGLRRLVPTWRALLGTSLVVALLLIGGFVTGYTLVHIPPANAMATAQSNVYFYADGTQIARDGEINRENVELTQIPHTVQRAVLAAEDRDFYSERAIDPQAMLRAGWNTLTGKGRQSGSTITQQYVKNYYLGQEQTVTRKVKEFFIAIKLDREQSKSDILKGYLNTSYFGRNAYGIQAASLAYYGKDVNQLGTAEGAYLASLLNAPSAYDVTTRPENKAAAVARWNYVLDGMVKERWLDADERDAMTFPMPNTARPATGLSGQRGYVVQAVEDYLTGHGIIDDNTLARGGYRITTTLQKPKQDAFVKAVEDHVLSKREKRRHVDRNVRVGGASIDPATGKVVAMYGGIDYTRQFVNNATRRDYQVGSTFKPFVFTAAVENGSRTRDGRRITPHTVYDGTDQREVLGHYGPIGYAPENEDNYSYGSITVRAATDASVNAVYAQMAQDVGPARVRETAVALGIPANTPDLTTSPSIALGVATASVLEMAEAYATLANHGRHGRYTLVESITRGGEEIDLPRVPTEQVISRKAADTTTAMLRSVVEDGTAAAARSAGRPAAGKTGTAEDDKAAWFAGYTPELATVVAVMGQDPDTAVQKPLYGALGLPRIGGGGPPTRIWAQYTAAALDGTEINDFDLELEEGVDLDDELLPVDGYPWAGDDRYEQDEREEDEDVGVGAPDTRNRSRGPTGGRTPAPPAVPPTAPLPGNGAPTHRAPTGSAPRVGGVMPTGPRTGWPLYGSRAPHSSGGTDRGTHGRGGADGAAPRRGATERGSGQPVPGPGSAPRHR